MPLRHPIRLNIWDRIDRIQQCLEVSETEIAERLKLTPKQYLGLRASNSEPSCVSVIQMLDELGLTLENFLEDKIDYPALSAQVHRGASFLPERYQKAAYSRKNTSMDILLYLESVYGWRYKNYVLKQLQVRENAFSDESEFISIQFLSDICNLLASKNHSASELIQMGKFTVAVNQGKAIGSELSKCRSIQEIYDLQINNLMGLYDHNFRYRTVRLDANSCDIEIRQNQDIADELKIQHLGSANSCLTRLGRAAALPGFISKPFSNVQETKCVHRGDSVCLIHLDFHQRAPIFEERVRLKSEKFLQ